MTFKSVFKKAGAIVCRAILDALQSEGKFNIYKIGLIVLTFALYSVFLSWKFALLLMVAIGWHESGHVWAMRQVGVYTRGFYFVPFFGGVAISGTNYASQADRVIVFIMGPLWGMLMALLTLILYAITGSEILGAAAYWQAAINLFNLIPVSPLDGGQIFRAIFSSLNKRVGEIFSVLSIAAFVGLSIKFHSPILIFAAVLALADFIANVKSGTHNNAIKLSMKEMTISMVIYLIVMLVLTAIVLCTVEPGKKFIELFLYKG